MADDSADHGSQKRIANPNLVMKTVQLADVVGC